MSTTVDDLFHVVTEGGVAAAHPPQLIHPALFGPATSQERNTVQEDLTPVACVQLKNARFEFDSSFVSPKVATEMQLLAKLHRVNSNAPVSIFGHADPVGNDEYNKKLSGRRSQAVYALLTRRTDLWEDLYGNPAGGDDWGTKSLQVMLATLGHYDGNVDGTSGPQMREAVRAFQSSSAGEGLKADGDPGRKTRPQLFKAYMDAICVDDAGQPFVLDAKTGFLAGGSDEGGRGDYQGCSEFNPLLLFSRAEQKEFQAPHRHTQRDRENEPNRRVMIFLFRPGTLVNLERWPCPRAKGGIADCKKRFWSDADARRSFGEERRFYEKTHDTFACRFYDRLAIDSPCEGGVKVVAPWAARWDRPLVRMDETARMILDAPNLPAGQTVIFEVTQEVEGARSFVGQTEVISDAGRVEAPWDFWFHPETIKTTSQLTQGESFPPVKFSFIARTNARETPSAVPVVYEDTIDLRLIYDETSDDLIERKYTLHSPWGTLSGQTDEKGFVKAARLPPGGVSLTLADYPLNDLHT